ncbi:uncharacterized protein LOC141691836 [Apium graveolens]|uniref:uncharacterized protein LOC141691836 n=1 Tax=Apium graveolens TaxID=4045 RepID=UPI003D7BDB7B
MPFGLINAGVTFQQMMDTIFGSQIGKNMLIYMDDMITKFKLTVNHSLDLRETFENARKHNLRLNPSKCSFRLISGKFPGFLVTQRGIEANPAQTKAILEMEDPKSIKDLQKLTGCIAALRRFIPQSSKRCLPFFAVIKRASRSTSFEWNNECKSSFAELKAFLTNPHILTRPIPDEALRVYLSASNDTVTAFLVWFDEGNEFQCTILVTRCEMLRLDTHRYNLVYMYCVIQMRARNHRPSSVFQRGGGGLALDDLKIQHIKASVAYPQANGLVEVTSRTILQGLKKRIEEILRCWVDELPNVLWSSRTTPRSATGETPFRLAYGVDVVLPIEISLISPMVEIFDPSLAFKGLRFNNGLIEETKEESRLRMIAQQENTAKYFNKKVKNKHFKVGDLFLPDFVASQPTISGILKPTWEGPYRVSKVVSAGTYELSHLDGQPIKNAWNDIHLKKFYQ